MTTLSDIFGTGSGSGTTGSGTDLSSFFSGIGTWAQNNPGLATSLVNTAGTLIDPAQAAVKTNSQNVNLPDYAAPYVGSLLNTAQGVISQPYTPYSGQRVADFNNDQQNAFQQYRDLTPTNALSQQGAGIVGQAANTLQGNAGKTWDTATMQQYMNPYQQGVTDIAINQNNQAAQQQNLANNTSAVRAGAFGGDRQAILQAELQKNTQIQNNNLQMTGANNAYNSALGAFNTGMQNSNQAAQAAGQAGNTLAGMGQNQFQNQLATAQGNMSIGNQQQQLQQTGLNTGYQNFLDQRNWPYQQLQFGSSMLAGLPMNGSNVSNSTTPPPSLTQQLIGNGIGGYLQGTSPTTTPAKTGP